jgi:hypothetical protein
MSSAPSNSYVSGGDVAEGTNLGFVVFVQDPDGQGIEILPMAYRQYLEDPGTSFTATMTGQV